MKINDSLFKLYTVKFPDGFIFSPLHNDSESKNAHILVIKYGNIIPYSKRKIVVTVEELLIIYKMKTSWKFTSTQYVLVIHMSIIFINFQIFGS